MTAEDHEHRGYKKIKQRESMVFSSLAICTIYRAAVLPAGSVSMSLDVLLYSVMDHEQVLWTVHTAQCKDCPNM